MSRLAPRLDGFPPEIARRLAMTVSCPDADDIPKVAHAGESRDHDGRRVQIMHNGLLVEEGGYYGDWMTETIRALRGHHEPQEELVFHRVAERLAEDGGAPVMIEFGSFWTYYGLWFCHALPGSRVIALEPDPQYLEVGKRNAALNGYTDRITFHAGAIGDQPHQPVAFQAESDGQTYDVVQHDLTSLMSVSGLTQADLVLADVQGAESLLIDQARGDFESGRVRFLIVSTHHHSISGDALTHQQALQALTDAGGHVIAEHSVGESFSGDGLIAVSFDDRDKNFQVPVSHARYRDSLFGELEHDLATATAARTTAEHTAATAQQLAEQLQAHIDAIHATKTWRWAKAPRELYARIKNR